MNREFLVNILLVVVLNLLIKTVYLFGIDRTVQNIVGEGEYGVYFTLLSFTFLFQIVTDLGVNSFNNRHIAQNRFLLDKYFPGLLILKGLLGLAFFLVILIFGLLSGYIRSYPLFVLGLATTQLLSSLVAFLRSNISGLGMYKTDSLVSVLDRLLMIIICGALLIHPVLGSEFKISWFIQCQILTLSITATVAFLVIKRKMKVLRFRFNPTFILLLLKKSAPYALAIFLMTVYTRLDTVMVDQLLTDGIIEADYYASAFRLFQASTMVGLLFAGLLLPMFARQLKEKVPINNLLQFSFKMVIGGALPLAISTVFFREEIMVWMYYNGSLYTGDILGLLMISFIGVSGASIYSALLTANESLGSMNRVFLMGALLNVLLNLLLIPGFKALGAAAATCITQFFIFFGLILLARKLLGLSSQPRLIFNILMTAILTVGSTYLVKGINVLDWQFRFVLSFGIGLCIAILFGLLEKRSFLELLQTSKT